MNFDFYLPKEYLNATLMAAWLSVLVLIGLFHYLNRYTKRGYFSLWTAAWLFYAIWLALHFHRQIVSVGPAWLMVNQWCIGLFATCLAWGSARFLRLRTRRTV